MLGNETYAVNRNQFHVFALESKSNYHTGETVLGPPYLTQSVIALLLEEELPEEVLLKEVQFASGEVQCTSRDVYSSNAPKCALHRT